MHIQTSLVLSPLLVYSFAMMQNKDILNPVTCISYSFGTLQEATCLSTIARTSVSLILATSSLATIPQSLLFNKESIAFDQNGENTMQPSTMKSHCVIFKVLSDYVLLTNKTGKRGGIKVFR